MASLVGFLGEGACLGFQRVTKFLGFWTVASLGLWRVASLGFQRVAMWLAGWVGLPAATDVCGRGRGGVGMLWANNDPIVMRVTCDWWVCNLYCLHFFL